jgi:hypothetical protein
LFAANTKRPLIRQSQNIYSVEFNRLTLKIKEKRERSLVKESTLKRQILENARFYSFSLAIS